MSSPSALDVLPKGLLFALLYAPLYHLCNALGESPMFLLNSTTSSAKFLKHLNFHTFA